MGPTDRLFEFAGNLANAASAEEAVAVGHNFYADFGAVHLVYAALDTLRGDPGEEAQFATTLPAWFLARYARESLGEKDHAAAHTLSGTLAPVLTGCEVAPLLPNLEEGALEFLEEARTTGLLSGICMPMPFVRPGMRGAVTVATGERERGFFTMLRAHEWEIRMAALYVHARMQALMEAEGAAPALSARQRECLLWLARGLRPEQIGDRLGLRRVTVDLHLTAARRKLKARTNEQAVARALAAGALGV